MGKILFALGTRPEAIKLAPLIHAARSRGDVQVRVVSTGQHREMLNPILDAFQIKRDFDLQLMTAGQELAELQTRISSALIPILKVERPDWLVVQGDTQTCMAVALTGYFMRIPVAHVEAGLRTHDLNAPWPEEFNRRVASLCAQVHFAPTEVSRGNLIREGIPELAVHVTGNTGVDAQLMTLKMLRENAKLNQQVSGLLPVIAEDQQVILATIHRREAHGEPLKEILQTLLRLVQARNSLHIILPVHKNPKVQGAVSEILGRAAHPRIHLLPPLDYIPFLAAMKRATVILTDSGGVQEEAPTLRKPVLVLRETTERMEAVDAGCAKLVGFDQELIYKSTLELLDNPAAREAMFANGNPFGDGRASDRIINILLGQTVRKTG